MSMEELSDERSTDLRITVCSNGVVNVKRPESDHAHSVFVDESGDVIRCSCKGHHYRGHCTHADEIAQRPLITSSAAAAQASIQRVATDGGQVLDESGSDDNEPREWEDPPLTEIVERFRDALDESDLDGWTLSTHRDLTEIGGFVRLYHDDAKIAIRVYDAISVSFDVEHADAERRRDRPNSNWRSESSLDSPDDALTVARALNGLTLDEREELGTKWLGMRALNGEVEA